MVFKYIGTEPLGTLSLYYYYFDYSPGMNYRLVQPPIYSLFIFKILA